MGRAAAAAATAAHGSPHAAAARRLSSAMRAYVHARGRARGRACMLQTWVTSTGSLDPLAQCQPRTCIAVLVGRQRPGTVPADSGDVVTLRPKLP